MPSFETAARSLMVVPTVAPIHSDLEIEAARMTDAHEEWEVILITAWLIAPCSAMKSEATGLLIPA